MKILVIDFETTGLDVATCQILQFACMVLDTEAEFLDSIDMHDIRSIIFGYPQITFKGNGLEAMLKNIQYAKKIITNSFSNNERFVYCDSSDDEVNELTVANVIVNLLRELQVETPALLGGKNIEKFDLPVLKRLLPGYEIAHQCVDPSSYFTDFKHDKRVPTLEVIARRLQVMQRNVYVDNLHDARYDVYHTAMAIWEMANAPKEPFRKDRNDWEHEYLQID